MLKLRSTAAALVLGIALAAPMAASAAVFIEVAPPAPIVEVRPAVPYPGWIWTDGYWDWVGGRHVWVPGRWVAPRPGFHWVGHHWVHERGGWRLERGHWAR